MFIWGKFYFIVEYLWDTNNIAMNKIIDKLMNFFRLKDEILGEWHTEDGSGLSMIMGSWVEFRQNGNGKYERWSNSGEETSYYYKGDFTWKRIGEKQIEVIEQIDTEQHIINYKLENINNRIELSNSEKTKIGAVKIEEFWNFAQIMFKLK